MVTAQHFHNMWETTLKLFENWGNRITYRILKLAGTSDETLNKYSAAVAARNQAEIEADAEMKKTSDLAKIIKLALVAVLGFMAWRFYKEFKKR